MSTKELLEIVKNRGLDVKLQNGEPVLVRPAGNKYVTDKLLAALKIHRQWIIEILMKKEKD